MANYLGANKLIDLLCKLVADHVIIGRFKLKPDCKSYGTDALNLIMGKKIDEGRKKKIEEFVTTVPEIDPLNLLRMKQ